MSFDNFPPFLCDLFLMYIVRMDMVSQLIDRAESRLQTSRRTKGICFANGRIFNTFEFLSDHWKINVIFNTKQQEPNFTLQHQVQNRIQSN